MQSNILHHAHLKTLGETYQCQLTCPPTLQLPSFHSGSTWHPASKTLLCRDAKGPEAFSNKSLTCEEVAKRVRRNLERASVIGVTSGHVSFDPFPPRIMEVEHGAAGRWVQSQTGHCPLPWSVLKKIHDLVTQKSGSMLTIDKNWETYVFSCRDRWHDTRIHIGSKFHGIKVQKMGISQNWGHSLSPQKQTHCQQRNGMLLVSIN